VPRAYRQSRPVANIMQAIRCRGRRDVDSVAANRFAIDGKLAKGGGMIFSIRYAAPVTVAVAMCFLVAPSHAQLRLPASIVTCVNPSSGTTWEINIDYSHSTVDKNPASISESEIAWRDRKDRWNYTLDRKTGQLTVIVASSTGGYMQFDRCKLP
jgi:hypothetical protein